MRIPVFARRAVFAIIFLGSMSLASAQVIPTTNAETLTGKKVTLPDAVRGHVSIFVVGFSRKSKDPTGDWTKKLRPLYAQDRDLQIYQAAHLQGAPRLIRGMIVSGMKKGVPPDQQDNFFVLYEAPDDWKRWVNFSEPDDAYIVLVDKAGQTVWRTHGPLNDAGINELNKEVQQLESH